MVPGPPARLGQNQRQPRRITSQMASAAERRSDHGPGLLVPFQGSEAAHQQARPASQETPRQAGTERQASPTCGSQMRCAKECVKHLAMASAHAAPSAAAPASSCTTSRLPRRWDHAGARSADEAACNTDASVLLRSVPPRLRRSSSLDQGDRQAGHQSWQQAPAWEATSRTDQQPHRRPLRRRSRGEGVPITR